MKKKKLYPTGLEVYPIGMGTIPIQGICFAEAERLITYAVKRGINFFDTSIAYSDAEEKLGAGLRGIRSQVAVATKTMKRSKEEIWFDLEKSLKNLKTDYIDLYQFHNISQKKDLDELRENDGYEAMLEAKQKKKIEYIGVSGHNPYILKEFLELYPVDTVMVPVNIFDLDFESVLEFAQKKGIATIGMKPFAGGLSEEYKLSLNYALSKVDIVIPGMKSIDEVKENLQVKSINFDKDKYEKLSNLLGSIGKLLCRQCGYCLPCPGGLDIPMIFKLYRDYFRFHEQKESVEAFKKMEGDCINCGKCEERCPYNLPIRELIVYVYKTILQS